MSKFIGVKMVEAVPMTAIEAGKRGYRNGAEIIANGVVNYPNPQGYEVTYEDGYKSWCPAEVFERSYYPIQDSNGEMLYRNDVEGFIDKVESIKIGTKTTNTTVTCLTGYEIHGQSACVKPENYDMAIGETYAKPKAIDAIWAHLGFVLQWAKYGLKYKDEVIPPHVQRMIAEHKELEQKLTKLSMFMDVSSTFKVLDSSEQDRMKKQRVAMDEYFAVLGERIDIALKDLNDTQTNK